MRYIVLFILLLFPLKSWSGWFATPTRDECFQECVEDKLPEAHDKVQTNVYLGICVKKCREYEFCEVSVRGKDDQGNPIFHVAPEHSSFQSFDVTYQVPEDGGDNIKEFTDWMTKEASRRAGRKMECHLEN